MAAIDHIKANGAALAAAINGKDANAAAALYTSDGAILPPGAGRFDGTAGIAGYWQAGIDGGLTDVVLETLEVEEFGDTATEVGVVTASKGGAALTGKYVVLWKKVGGVWKLHRDIFNFDT